jgi:hypothetical protein
MAGRCPHCLSNDQMVHGRLIFLILLLIGILALGHYYSDKETTSSVKEKKVEEVYESK